MPENSRMAGHALVEQLVALGADMVFCVPGESFLGVLDGLFEHRDAIRVITNRQEGGTAMMASAYGQLTGRPGLAMVTRGPGASNASIGVHMVNPEYPHTELPPLQALCDGLLKLPTDGRQPRYDAPHG